MSGCCSEEEKAEGGKNKEKSEDERSPKSFAGKYLYKVGKKDFEKSRGKAKKDCC